MENLLNYWYLFITLWPAIALAARGISEGLVAAGSALGNAEIGAVGNSIGKAIEVIGKFIGYFGAGVPSWVKKSIASATPKT